MKLNEEIQRLRADGSSPEAKGRVIQAIQRKHEHKTMKLIGKLSIPAAALAAVAIGVSLTMPRTALASPSTVAKAIRDIRNYVINSYVVINGQRTLTSRTTVSDGKSSRQFFDPSGKPVAEGRLNKLDGALFELTVGHPINGEVVLKGDGGKGDVKLVPGKNLGGPGEHSVEVKAVKGPDGKVVKHTFLNGKEVKELPDNLKGHVEFKMGDGHGEIGTTIHEQIGTAKKSSTVVDGMMVVEGDKNGKVSMFASGQTSVDSLLKLLDDPSRWTVQRGVNFGGMALDKFTLNSPHSPIELLVDPATSLPRFLRFIGPESAAIPLVEDEYVYGVQPPH
ncbi:MAG: hypothetical protein JSS66_09890 [Armatimonadetes bacterium]|nr:hypothetical protein [Armatimonadota bacterium]